MNVPSHDEMIAAIEAFLSRHPAISERQIGIDVANDSALVSNLRSGRSPRLTTLNKLADYMSEQDSASATPSAGASPGNSGEFTASPAGAAA